MESQTKEFKLRLPRDCKKFNVMRMNSATSIDMTTLNEPTLTRKQIEQTNRHAGTPLYGQGSQYGIQQKQEARRRKWGILGRQPKPEDQPLILRESGKKGKSFVGRLEGGVNTNSSYFILSRASDTVFEAFPVNAWYNFTPTISYKTLDADEAEEQFGKRNKTYNYFAVMLQKKMQNEVSEDKVETTIKPDQLKVKDDSWLDVSSEDEDEQEGKQKSGKAKASLNEDAKDDVEDPDEFQSHEVDYISDSSSEEEERERLTKGSPKVEEEDKAEDERPEDERDKRSEDEESESAEEDDSDNDLTEKGKETKELLKRREEKSGSEDEGSDVDEDFDADMQVDEGSLTQSTSNDKQSPPETETNQAEPPTKPNVSPVQEKHKHTKPNKGKKRANDADLSSHSSAPLAKKDHPDPQKTLATEGVTEADVRRYLRHKPMTTKELLKKFKRKTNMEGHDLVVQLGNVLKKVNPQQEKVKGKVLLSLKK